MIGILTGIALATYGNVQANGRNAERKSDTLSIKSQLEVYFNENGAYPTAAVMSNSNASTVVGGSGILKGLSVDAIVSPNATSGTTNSITTAPTSGNPPTNVYWYQAYQSNGSTPCTSITTCAKFKLMYTEEVTNQVITIHSIN